MSMRRGKPQQQIYRPGSGPLRRSGAQNIGLTESDTKILFSSKQGVSDNKHKQKSEGSSPREPNLAADAAACKLGDMASQDEFKNNDQRKSKKPDQSFYVPKVISQTRDSSDNLSTVDSKIVVKNSNNKEDVNGSATPRNEAKRYSNRWKSNESNDFVSNQHGGNRQGSEPRRLPNNGGWSRETRDTRSVETSVNFRNYGGEKQHYMKPPTGRRHSSVGIEQDKRPSTRNIDALPPRLKKKFLENNKLIGGYVGAQSEGNWDGNSLVFQGTSQLPQHKYPPKQNYSHQQSFNFPMDLQHQKMPSHNQHHMPNNYQHVYYTLPHKGRGRIRLPEDYDNPSFGRMYRSTTPESMPVRSPCSSRPSTPTHNINRNNSRPQTPVHFSNRPVEWERNKRPENDGRNVPQDRSKPVIQNENERKTPPRGFRQSLEAQLSPVSPPTPSDKLALTTIVPVSDKILDWSEEVELEGRLEAEASDALTRSSSVTSLVDTSTASQQTQAPKKHNKRKNKRNKRRNNSRNRDSSPYNAKNFHDNNNRNNQNTNKDSFKVPESRQRWRQNTRDGGNRSRNVSRESSYDRSHNEPENWRDEILRSRHNSEHEKEGSKEPEYKKGGLIILPTKEIDRPNPPALNVERPKYPVAQQQRSLFDPNNPTKPIIVKANSSRVNTPGFTETVKGTISQPHLYTTDQFGNQIPIWYDENSEGFKLCHYPALLKDVQKADFELHCICSDSILMNWSHVVNLRRFLMDSLQYLLCKDLKFCQSTNLEQHFWKILFHNIIETMRHAIIHDPNNKAQHKEFILWVIDEGTKYFENLLNILEETYKFKLTDYLGDNNLTPKKGLGYVGLALISAQKLFIALGDLARYREQVNETTNYGKCRQWYIKAHEINPKNGRPYNQLAVVAVNSKRKLDAVYCYMRSLMSTHPVQSARENLISVFDENRKKYEQGERKRREERLEKARQHMKEKESESAAPPGSLRREIWIRPDGGRRVHRTTSAVQEPKLVDSEEEDLAALSCAEVNKRFVTSYLHVHGKLITKIGMETFQESALQMLKEFRTLLQHTPIPLNSNRLLQLLALNMFAIESTQLKDPQLQEQKRYRSELQERALVISLQMFNLILERCVSLFHDHIRLNPDSLTKLTNNSIPQDFHTLLPAVKIWCDWMLCHSSVWNPPPSMQDYRVGPAGDAWSRLASLMNLLEKLDQSIALFFVSELQDGYEMVRLPEDVTLHGFIPLMYNEHEPTYAPKEIEPEIAQLALRLSKVLFFGTTFLCGVDPPVLKLEIDNDFSEYISVVSTSSINDTSPSPTELINEDVVMESFSEDEEDEKPVPLDESTTIEDNPLLRRKVELEKWQRSQELHRQRVQKILQQSVVTVHIEIRPKILVPDTNCFIDHLAMIKSITAVHVYTLMVPLVVLNELEGLARGGKYPAPLPRVLMDPQHILKVAESAKRALEYLGNRQNNIKCVTAKGTTLTTFTFTSEEDSDIDSTLKNDDKILATCLMLCKNNRDQLAEGEPKKLYREVVLLTEDRNLRVKALARDLPVRDLPGFLQWAGLG